MFALFFALVLNVGIADSTETTLVGTVVDSATEAVIQGATITFPGDVTAESDTKGVFLVKGAFSGEITFTIEADGYETKTMTVTVTGDQNWILPLDKASEGSED